MTSKECMLLSLGGKKGDYVPCSFMLFFNLYHQCSNESEFVEKQVDLGLDAVCHTGYLPHRLHPDTEYKTWEETESGKTVFCRNIDTPKGPLTARVFKQNGWPTKDHFPIMDDWNVPRSEEFLVKPEQDLEKIEYLFGGSHDEDILKLKETAGEAAKMAEKFGLLSVGGWKGGLVPGSTSDFGIMGCDSMAWLSGYVDVMTLSLERPEIIKEYAEIIHRWNKRQIEIYLDVTESDLIIRRGWYETTEFWTPGAFRDIIFPTLKREADLVHQAGKKYGYIITSAFLPLLDDILESGVDVLIGLDPEQGKGTEIASVKRRCKEKGMSLWGGVSGALTVEQGTEEDTRSAVKNALETLGDGGGFILSPVDNVRDDTPNARKNTDVFIDAWKKYRSF
jgi:hypothetical protein